MSARVPYNLWTTPRTRARALESRFPAQFRVRGNCVSSGRNSVVEERRCSLGARSHFPRHRKPRLRAECEPVISWSLVFRISVGGEGTRDQGASKNKQSAETHEYIDLDLDLFFSLFPIYAEAGKYVSREKRNLYTTARAGEASLSFST